MTVWTSVNEKPKYGVAIHNYQPCEKTGARFGLSIHVGELLEIACESESWYYGRRIAGRRPEEKGVVPKGYVRLRDCSVDRTGSVEIVSVVQPQIVQEITQTLRSWGQHWKHLYVTSNEQFRFIEVSMRTLLQLRSAILSGTLPLDQLKKVQRTAIYTMDRGNRELGMDLTVRCATTGVQIDPRNVSTCQLYSFHVETSESIKQRNQELGHNTSHSSSQSQNTSSSYSFFASVRNFVCKMSEDAELLMSLYDGSDHKHFTESYVVRWSKGGLASDIDQLHNLRVLFTDLGTSDIKREKVYLVCYVVRIGGMEPQNVDNRRSSVAAALASGRSISQSGGSIGSGIESWGKGNGMRRPLGVAAMDITHFLSGQLDVDDDKHHCVTFFPCEKDNLDTLLRRIIANKDLKGDAKTGQGLWLSVKLLRGDIKQIKEEVPHLVVGNVSIARKMGFPEVILPGDARNDLYLCLVQGCFTRGTGKSTDRNIQITTRVCNQHGQMIPGVISSGGGVQPLNEYNSVVYYHEDKPRWLETFKICVPIEEFKQAHVVFLFKHRSSNEAKDKAEKPFALAYTPLMQPNGTTLNDTQHCLNVYKVDGKKWPSNDIDAAACYLSLPSQRATPVGDKENNKLQRGFLSLSSKDSFLIGTNVCSTKLTQNVELLGVLNWCDHVSDDSLRQSLTSLQTVPGGEVVKFLQDILDALFSILTQADIERGVDSESDRYGSYDFLVFECLLSLISLVSDRKFHHFQPVLDLYIKESFCATLAYKKLCRLLSQLVLDADKGDNDVLLRSMKCLEYLVRFIVRSRELHSELTQRSDQHDFQQLFQRLLDSIVVMMRCDSKNALTSQGACIKYLPSSVPHIIQVFPDSQLATMIGEIFDVLPLERLTKQRLIAILDLVQGPLFLNSECRYILLKHVTTNLNTLIINNDETNRCGVEIRSKFRSVDKVARLLGASRHKLQEHRGYSEQLELCVKILSEILTLLFRKDVGPTDHEFNHLTSSLLRTIIKATTQMDKDNPLVCQLVAVLLEMLRQMNVERYNEYLKLFTEPSQLLDFLIEVQIALRELVERPVFHSHWADMINLQYYIVLSTIRLFSATLKESFYDYFEIQVWSNWFHLAVGFLTRPSLQLERRLPEQRRRVTSQFGDMRRDAAKQIHTMWFNLGQYKTQFVPTLVGPFLEMSLIPEIELRKATIPLFFDMMLCEYNSSKYLPESYVDSLRDVTHIKGNFNDFENEMIHKLDVLVEGGSGDADWSSLFVSIVGELCAGHTALRDAGGHFVHVVGQLLDTLLQYRALHDHSSMDYRMQATTTLLDFYSDIKRPEMYIRYVNKLCELHLECDNWTEAGLTQRLHAKLLQWSNVPLSTLLRSHRHPLCQTHRDLKEALYYEIISYLDKGKMWELAVGVCKELVTQYEEEVFDYCHLSELYHMMSGFYAAIVKQPRPQPEYFRVGYYGKGFPHFLQNKVFVYKGKDYERLQDFSARTLNGLPNAELMAKLSPPGDDIKNSSEQYVQINAVEPIMSDHNRMSGKPISDRILKFHQHNNVNKFRYSRPIYRQDETLSNSGEEKSQNEFGMLWLERTELEIREKLPGILRWCPVVKSVTHEMSPLQVAVETMKEANRVLRTLVIEHRADHTLPLDPLTRKLNGMVDAAVMGGIVNYEKAFFTEDYLRAHPEHRGLISTLKDLIASQIPLLEFGIEVHRVRLPPSLAPLHQRIAECFEKMKAHVHNNYGKKSCDLEKEISMVTMRRQMSVLGSRGMSFTENSSDNRWSEISTQTNHSVESGISMGRTQANNSLKAFTSQFNKQSNRGSLGSGYASLGLPAARKRDKDRRRGRKSEVAPIPLSSAPSTPSSQWYTGPTPPLTVANGNTRNAVSTDFSTTTTIVELRQELTPSRPLRSEVEKERRLSQRPTSLQSGTNSNRNSAGTTDSNISNEDDPPPLPQKTVRTDHNITNPLLNLTPISSESYYQAVNFLVTSSPIKSDNNSSMSTNSRSAMTSPVMMRQDYDTVFTPRDSALYKSLQPGAAHALRKNLNRKERAPTPPPKKRLHSVQN